MVRLSMENAKKISDNFKIIWSNPGKVMEIGKILSHHYYKYTDSGLAIVMSSLLVNSFYQTLNNSFFN